MIVPERCGTSGRKIKVNGSELFQLFFGQLFAAAGLSMESVQNLTMEEEELVACLRKGRKNAKTRKMLVLEMDMKDRRLRKLIESAQAHGALIGNLSDGDGYFLIDDPSEGASYYAQENSRAMKILRKIEPLQKWLLLMGVKVY